MNRLQCTCAGLAALLWLAVPPVVASSAPDTWHGGGPDVIVFEGGPADPEAIELDDEIAGVLPNTGWVTVLGIELRGREGPYQYETGATTGAQWCTGTERFADSRIELPHNATIQFFRMWGFDNSADHDVAAILFESCLPTGSGTPVNTNIELIQSTGTPFTFTVTSAPNFGPTDLQSCTYHVRVRFGADCGGGGQTTIRKMRVQYALLP